MTESKLQFQLTLNAKHEGETCAIDQKSVGDSIRSALTGLLQEELDDEDTEVRLTLYFSNFEYNDNLDSMREIIVESLTTCDAESLTQIIEVIKNG